MKKKETYQNHRDIQRERILDPGEAVLKGRRNGGAEYIGEYISGIAY
jgi:hypothetical protein